MSRSHKSNGLTSHQEELSCLSEEEWSELWLRLRHYTNRHFPHLKASGIDTEDIIHEAILNVLEGKRNCSEDVPLVVFICGVIKSKASHVYRRAKLHSALIEQGKVDWVMSPDERPQKLDTQRELEIKSFWRRLNEKVAIDPVLKVILSAFSSNPYVKPSEVAADSGLDISEIKNGRKRLARKARKLWLDINEVEDKTDA